MLRIQWITKYFITYLCTQLSTWPYNYCDFNVLGLIAKGFIILQVKPFFLELVQLFYKLNWQMEVNSSGDWESIESSLHSVKYTYLWHACVDGQPLEPAFWDDFPHLSWSTSRGWYIQSASITRSQMGRNASYGVHLLPLPKSHFEPADAEREESPSCGVVCSCR